MLRVSALIACASGPCVYGGAHPRIAQARVKHLRTSIENRDGTLAVSSIACMMAGDLRACARPAIRPRPQPALTS